MKIKVTITYKNGKTTVSTFSHMPSAQSFARQMRIKGCKVKINQTTSAVSSWVGVSQYFAD